MNPSAMRRGSVATRQALETASMSEGSARASFLSKALLAAKPRAQPVVSSENAGIAGAAEMFACGAGVAADFFVGMDYSRRIGAQARDQIILR